MGLKRFHISANIPGQTACHTPAGVEAGLSNFSGKQKFLKKTIAFVAHSSFSHRLLPVIGGISEMVAYVLDAHKVQDLSSPWYMSFPEEKVQQQKE